MSPKPDVEGTDLGRLRLRLRLRGVTIGLLEAAVEGAGLKEILGVAGLGDRQAKQPLKLSWDANSPASGTRSIDGIGTSDVSVPDGVTGLGAR